jgi:DNA-directed RNA polymerase specialized sigma24 family protein
MEAMTAATEPIDAFDEAYGSLFGELTRLCQALGAAGSSEDIAQEVLLEGRGRLAQLRDPAKLRPWLRTIAVRRVGRERRRGLTALTTEPVFLPVDPGLGVDASAAVARLPERERMAVVLVHGLGYRQEEAAEMMGLRRGTVAASLWKARHKLARDLASYRDGGER